jgi:EAL domain-containing protein (putative c-di-GMP-specific phosphodiesterase class I)
VELSLLDRILQPGGLSVVFQPVLHRHGSGWRLHALEGLVRGPRGTNMESAEVLFEYVRRKREETTVDRACVATILEAVRDLAVRPRINVNVHASTLGRDRGFVRFVAESLIESGHPASRLTMEIVEHSPFWDGRSFLQALDDLRALGVAIALDDVGLGQSNYRMILESRPDYFKVDRFLVTGAGSDYFRRAVLRSIAELAGAFGAFVVAEGIEQPDDLQTAVSEGLTMAQGFLLGRPQAVESLRDTPLVRGETMSLESLRARPKTAIA